MCGRYQIELTIDALREICEDVQRKQRENPEYEQLAIKYEGEVFPTDIVPVQTELARYEPMRWGFTGFDGRLVINARSETALTKPTFRQPMLERRCLIPASAYFEWQKLGSRKVKYRIYNPESPLFFAGCYRQEREEPVPRFVILTQEASHTLHTIHDRMPVILPSVSAEVWLSNSPTGMVRGIDELSYQPV